jgi:hypothetical protein
LLVPKWRKSVKNALFLKICRYFCFFWKKHQNSKIPL